MIRRTLHPLLLERATAYPVVILTGPRQSGKTTLVRAAFPAHSYMSVEDPDHRAFALEDPRGFLGQFSGGAVLDEVQRAPDLLSYLQTEVDRDPTPGRFILTGSQNLLLLRSVSQSLAGRATLLHLLPLSLAELQDREPMNVRDLGRLPPRPQLAHGRSLIDMLFTGFYPRIHDQNLDPAVWLRDYYQTYVERDVRELLAVGDLETFGRFVRLCAGRTGQLMNLSGLASDAGISHTTASRWISVLEASFIIVLLRPHHRNFNKRLIKSPKLYFLDPALVCYLLRIRSPDDLRIHAARGPVFETFVISELLKAYHHRGEEPDLYFWRDLSGREMDVLIDLGDEQVPIEVKSGETVASDWFKALEYWRMLVGNNTAPGVLVYGGDRSYVRNGFTVYAWKDL